MPRWWLWTFYATIVWGVLYVILFPAWPLVRGATPGLLGYSSRATVAAEVAEARAANAPLDARLNEAELAAILDDPELLQFAVAGGGAVFRNNCSQCHGAGGQGAIGGYPNLLDDSWLWGGTIDDIHQTILHGIRYEPDPDTRFSQMPAFGEILAPAEIDGLVQYVLSLSGAEHDADVAAAHAQTFADNCASCHGEGGEGMIELGRAEPDRLDLALWRRSGDDPLQHPERALRHHAVVFLAGPPAPGGHPQGRGLRPQPRRRPVGRRPSVGQRRPSRTSRARSARSAPMSRSRCASRDASVTIARSSARARL